jgi:polar amino acid transport system substrate-binding protein
MNIKYSFIFTLITAILISAIIFNGQGMNLSDNRHESIVFKVAGDNNFPPYEYVDENENYVGFNVDIMRAIALSTGVEVYFYPMTWNETGEKLLNGDVDIIQGMKYTKERDRYYDFSEEYLENSQSIFVQSDNVSINEFKDLTGKRIALQRGDVATDTLNKLKDAYIVFTENQEQAINELLEGHADAYIGNTLTGGYLINKLGAMEKVKIVGETLNPTKYSMAVKEGSKETLEIINKGIAEIKRNGTYDKIYRKWFGRPVGFPSWYLKRMLYLVAGVVMIFLVTIIVSFRWTTILKREVANRTRELNDANLVLQNRNRQINLERDFIEQLLNNISNGVVTVNDKDVITFANKPAEKILNLGSNILVGNNYRETLIKDIFSRDKLPQDRGNKEIFIDNRKAFISYRIDLLHNMDDEEEAIVIFRDMTEEKLMQESIRTKDKLQSLGNLITGIAHEIRNPLTSIKAYASLIPKKLEDPKFRMMISKDIPQEIDRLNALINSLLEYSRPRKPFMENVCLFDELNSALLLLKNNIQKGHIKLKNNVGKELYVSFDKNHLRQILINILLNAFESMDDKEKIINISAEAQGNIISLSIEDNGCGIDENDLSKVYNPFYTTKPTGTGLGLYVCYQLASENNADIKIDSIIGEGTTCTLVFKEAEEYMHGEAFNS